MTGHLHCGLRQLAAGNERVPPDREERERERESESERAREGGRGRGRETERERGGDRSSAT